MSIEQLGLPVPYVDEKLPPLTNAQIIERYIDSAPPTQGMLDGPLADAADGVYVSPNLTTELQGELPQLVEVELLPGAQLGAADSHHGVVFGSVAVKVGEKHMVVDTAIKEFTTDSEKAKREHDCLLAAKQRGFETFEPLAVARDGEHTYLITKLRDEVTSMDNEDWTISPSDAETYNSTVVPNLHYMADKMAELHAKGIFHGDAQPKNFARTDTGEFVAMDLEDGEVAYSEEELVAMISGGWEPRDSRARADLWHCWYAMTHPINGENPDSTVKGAVFLEGETYETCMEEFENNFLNPYFNALQRHSSPDLFKQFNAEELRASIYDYTARTT